MDFFQAISFLTIIRCDNGKHCDDKDVAAWGRYFFIVGLLIGAAAAGIDYVLLKKFSGLTASVVCAAFIAVITGGLHLDGVGDVFDAAFCMKSVPEKLKIMKESSIGAFGAIAITFVIALKIAFLAEITGDNRLKAILLFPAVSRGALLAPAYFFNYPKESGKGLGFIKNMTPSILIFGLVVSTAASYGILQWKGILLNILAVLFSISASFFFNKRFNGITGDVLGCVNELTEIFVLLCLALL